MWAGGARIKIDELNTGVDSAAVRLGGDDRCRMPEDIRVPSPVESCIDAPHTVDDAPREPSTTDIIRNSTSLRTSAFSARSVGRLKQIAQSVLTRNKYMRSRIVDLLLFAQTNKTLIVIIMILL